MARRTRRHDPQPSSEIDLPVSIVRGAFAGIAASLLIILFLVAPCGDQPMPKQPKSIQIALPPQFVARCEHSDVSPKDVLEGFIRDVCALDGCNGSDERDLAQRYFDRAAPWRF